MLLTASGLTAIGAPLNNRWAAENEDMGRVRDRAHRLLVVQEGVTLLDQRHQVLSVVVSVGLSLNAVDVFSGCSEDGDGVMAYEHHAIQSIYSAAHSRH
jgi:hypothetical protein